VKRDISSPALPLSPHRFYCPACHFSHGDLMVKCLVCNREVVRETPGLTEVHKGEKIYFCSNVCKTEFKKYPGMHLTESARQPK
jgi:YHS domain-containing protein